MDETRPKPGIFAEPESYDWNQIVDDLNFEQQRDTVAATNGPEHRRAIIGDKRAIDEYGQRTFRPGKAPRRILEALHEPFALAGGSPRRGTSAAARTGRSSGPSRSGRTSRPRRPG